MKLKKYIICASTIGFLSIGGLVISNANDTESTTKSQNEVVSAYNNLHTNHGIEHVKLTYSNGEYLDIYRDRKNGEEKVDYYDELGNLITRDITTDFGATMLTIGPDSSTGKVEYTGVKSILPDELARENKVLLSKSIIDSFMNLDSKPINDLTWKKARSNDGDTSKYSSTDGNIYVDTKNGNLEKREIMVDGELYQTIECEILNKNAKNATNLFSLDSEFSSEEAEKDTNSINLNNIKIIESNVGEESDFPKDINAVG